MIASSYANCFLYAMAVIHITYTSPATVSTYARQIDQHSSYNAVTPRGSYILLSTMLS